MSSSGNSPSLLMLEECFGAADDRFLDELFKVHSPKVLQNYAEKLTADPRPWARQIIIRYLQSELSFQGHQTFFKRLFRHAESKRDHELMSWFLVALDRLVRRCRVTTSFWNRQERRTIEQVKLFAAPNAAALPDQRFFAGRKKQRRLFSQRTRAYLRRRVWRYFRWLSYRDPNAYVQAMSKAIAEYTDADFKAGENILDNWSLMHLCYFGSDVLKFSASHCNLVPGKSLSELTAAPYRAVNWSSDEGFAALTSVLSQAKSSLVRIWSTELLQREHRERLNTMPMAQLMLWLRCDDQAVQQFAVDIFERHPELPVLPVTTWLELLKAVPATHLPVICKALTKHVALARLTNEQVLQLVRESATPVAELGLQFLQMRHAEKPLPAADLATTGSARCESIGGRLAEWVLGQMNTRETWSIDHACEFFDSQNEACRSAAMDWIEKPSSIGHHDSALWARLTETPFDDVRLQLVRILQRRTAGISKTSPSLDAVWCSVLLGVHRGGREKLSAMDQIRNTIESYPERAAALMPVLAVAARSLRVPERRRALSTFASLLAAQPSLSTSIGEHIPELKLVET